MLFPIDSNSVGKDTGQVAGLSLGVTMAFNSVVAIRLLLKVQRSCIYVMLNGSLVTFSQGEKLFS
jgi:hypothetical protein